MKRNKVYLLHIRDALIKIESYIAIGYDRFMVDSHWQDAVIRQLEIIGEAKKTFSGIEVELSIGSLGSLAANFRFARCTDTRLYGS